MTSSQVIEIAKHNADTQGWIWKEPVQATLNKRKCRWEVRSNSGARGCNVVTKVDDKNGRIVDAKFLPR